MEKNSYVLWFYGEPVVAMKINDNGTTKFMFCYSFSKFDAIGVDMEEMKESIEDFVKNKEERTVLSEDIEKYELVNLDEHA